MGAFTLYTELQSLLNQKEQLEKRITAIRDELKTTIQPGGESEGISHIVTSRRSVKYAEAVKRIIDLIVADSRKPKAWSMVEQLTTESQTHSFKPSEQVLFLPTEEMEGTA